MNSLFCSKLNHDGCSTLVPFREAPDYPGVLRSLQGIRLHVYERVGILLVEVYKKAQLKGYEIHLMSFTCLWNSREIVLVLYFIDIFKKVYLQQLKTIWQSSKLGMWKGSISDKSGV